MQDREKLEHMEATARNIGRRIGDALPEQVGFALLLFTYDATPEKPGLSTYISSAKRDDMIRYMEECIAKLRARVDVPPGTASEATQ